MPLRSYCSCGRVTEPGCRRCDRCEAEHRSRKASSRHANRPPSPWQSPEWRALRNRLVKQAGNECSVCGAVSIATRQQRDWKELTSCLLTMY